MKKESAKATKLNFWNDLRVKNGYSYDDLSSTLELAPSTIAMWFSGRQIPAQKHLVNLCMLFGVDEKVGREEFIKAKAAWQTSRTKEQNAPKKKHKVELVPMVAADPEVVKTTPTEKPIKKTDSVKTPDSDIFRKLYGVLSYDDYEEFRAISKDTEDPLKFLYKKIDFDDFIKILDILKGSSAT